MDTNQQDLLAQFCGMTGADSTSARTALESVNWNLSQAVELYFEEQEGRASTDASGPSSSAEQPPASHPPPATAPSAEAPASSSSSSRRPPQNNSRLRTLQDLQPSAQDDEDEDDKDQDLFAGGEKSGLAVQNPGSGGRPTNHFRNIMNQARQNRERPPSLEDEDEPAGASRGNFTGRAQTLGGDDAPSRVIEDPHAALHGTRARLETISRVLHLWRDGVSVDDGPLFRFDDPANEHIMAQINRGQAPLSLLDVQPNQEVDLTLEPHKDENYVQPKKQYKAFGGQGQRLGSPVPGPDVSASSTTSNTTVSTVPASTPAASTNTVDIDESAPTISLQIRLGDGTRLSSRFNATHTIAQVYDFVDRAQATQRSYVLMTTFPSKELSDRAQQLGELSEFKRGGVVVQKWT